MKKVQKRTLVRKVKKLKQRKYSKFFTVIFRKRTTDKLRTMNCRLGVTKGIKHVGLPFDPNKKGLMVVWCRKRQAFRMINLREIKELHLNHEKYKVKD